MFWEPLSVVGPLLGQTWLSPGYLVLRVNAWENPGCKNRVMIVAPSLFGVVWHKEHQTKNKWLNFCLLGFYRLCSRSRVLWNLSQFACQHLSAFKQVVEGSKKVKWVRNWGHVARKCHVSDKAVSCRNWRHVAQEARFLYMTGSVSLFQKRSIFSDSLRFLFVFGFFSCSYLTIWDSVCPSVCSLFFEQLKFFGFCLVYLHT